MKNKVTMLMMVDGFGINTKKDGNAFKLAKTPNIDKLMKKYPTSQIETSGPSAGLPEGQMGSSDVSYTNINAGRVVCSELTRITNSIEDGDFFSNSELISAIDNCKEHNSKMHLIGLLSDGGIHSHIRHLYALLELAKRRDFEDVCIHCILDGRDTPPASAEGFITDLEEKIKEKGVGKIASISGRYYSMDKDANWERTKEVYDALVCGKGDSAREAIPAIEQSYQKEVFDEFVEPILITNPEGKATKIQNNDSVLFFNYRTDRVSQLAKALIDPNFEEFKTKDLKLYLVSITDFVDKIPNVHIAFKKPKLKNTFFDIIQKNELTQLTFIEHVKSYKLKPEKSIVQITDDAIEAINSEKNDLIILNFVSLDIAGHTGDLRLAIHATEIIDECIGKIVETIKKKNGTLLITSSHGNCEQMIDYKTGEPHTSHTTNPVPLILVTEKNNLKLKSGKLADLTPTMLNLMEIDKPEEMTGESLLEQN